MVKESMQEEQKFAEKEGRTEIETCMREEEGLENGGDFLEDESGRAEKGLVYVTKKPKEWENIPDREGETGASDGETQVTT